MLHTFSATPPTCIRFSSGASALVLRPSLMLRLASTPTLKSLSRFGFTRSLAASSRCSTSTLLSGILVKSTSIGRGTDAPYLNPKSPFVYFLPSLSRFSGMCSQSRFALGMARFRDASSSSSSSPSVPAPLVVPALLEDQTRPLLNHLRGAAVCGSLLAVLAQRLLDEHHRVPDLALRHVVEVVFAL
eukprot:CAMPEP_0196744150 /NCGR_PEP_ID=MMETSP1091-20130531/56199_1 /TAXON_ID=302021 /ORGANISM="Rhodomonas sp., Strain CCMP768" /LENGTH=186 /DNA_ID=CAMNT_0042090647 /DNA_START=206 /DNA_END=765 /DNA_ORIENTATION=+